MGADDLMRSTETRAQQCSVIASPPMPPPAVNTLTSAFRPGGMSMYETRRDEKLSEGLLREDSHKSRGEYDIEVQVEMAVIRDTR